MHILKILGYFIFFYIFFYFLFVFVLSRLFIPHLNTKIEVPHNIPKSMQSVIDKLKATSSDPQIYLYAAYDYLSSKYKGVKKELWKDKKCLFLDLEQAWNRQGFLVCTLQNYLLIIFLLKSDYFTTRDIRKVHMFYGFNIHQYVQVKLNNQWVPVDIWSHNYGLRIGDKPKPF